MKKLLIAGVALLYSFSNAQIKTGTVYISGQVNYTETEVANSDFTDQTFKIIPTAGVFIAPNLAIGTGLGYTVGKLDYTQTLGGEFLTTFIDYTGKTSAVTVAPFVRKYWTLSEKLYFFGQLQIPLEFGKINQHALITNIYGSAGSVDQQAVSYDSKYTSIGINVKPGFDYFLNKNWSVEATIGEFGYKNLKSKEIDARDGKNYDFGLNLSAVSFGVKYIFAK
ncbi:outer membrane beta-barrel protein [Chryseobacterium sp. SN22]|uniref:outer membrane beta-barrel protein n=1 Tax=Chryseobacterium sp. SN22 TaxID=2606431 RepID=UPI0011ECF861|nr:outer membrane beta-barrel protein [Chryseobacterium sp. SN22]KAA0127662.1 outer membrane beta-barrel protein [Chryseobacterium sp. SN22]